jgi:hypothetical protein
LTQEHRTSVVKYKIQELEMNDNLDDILNEFNSIRLSNDKNKSKAREYRDLLERVLYHLFDIPRTEKHSPSTLIFKLGEHPEAFRKKLQPKARLMYKFFSLWSHDNPEELGNEELEIHRIKLKKFIETAFDVTIEELNQTSESIESGRNRSVIKINDQMSSAKETRTYFKISENWYGEAKFITVKFKTGKYQDEIFCYDHDYIYDQTLSYLKTLPCWGNDGYYSNSRNIPGWAKEHLSPC